MANIGKYMNKEDRIKYYFGDFFDQKIELIVDSQYSKFKLNEIYLYKGSKNTFYLDEIEDLECLVVTGDGSDNLGMPALMKTRYINKINNGIIGILQYSRHWSPTYLNLNKIKWSDKIDNVIWRGAHTTGWWKKPNRKELVEKYYTKYNIKYSSDQINKEKDNYFIQNYLLFDTKSTNIEDHLLYKYIIMMEGNDKASGLNWALKSNSLVMMTPPSVESWLMENCLIPWKHYIPLEYSLDDLPEKINWCQKNDNICQDIVRTSSEYMNQFSDNYLEKDIQKSILKLYKENIKLIYD
jgi:hypothetical protein